MRVRSAGRIGMLLAALSLLAPLACSGKPDSTFSGSAIAYTASPVSADEREAGGPAEKHNGDADVRIPQISAPSRASVPTQPEPPGQWPRFVEGMAPSWPFVGVVQLWAHSSGTPSGDADAVWWLRYWPWGSDAHTSPQVPLPGLEVGCFGGVGMVSHGEGGIEVGGTLGTESGSYLVRWGEPARRLEGPSEALAAEIATRPSTLEAGAAGDVVWLAVDDRRTSYAMREPPRAEGDWWRIQARRDGALLVMTVHPANHECFSGVTWLVDGVSGEVVACGANTWATRFVAPDSAARGAPVLPEPDEVGTYLGCGPRLDLALVPVRRWTG